MTTTNPENQAAPESARPTRQQRRKDSRQNAKIVEEAKKRWERCVSWESEFRKRAEDDIKFGNGDADNLWQWPDDIKASRNTDKQPCLTVNKVRQHCLLIVNDAKQNKPGVSIRPVGNGATVEAAKVYMGIVRHIEYISRAENIYDWATNCQVYGGVGYWRIVTDYVDDDSFDQEIYIRRIRDWRSVYIDPDAIEPDASDSSFGFVYSDIPKDIFDTKYPLWKDKVGAAVLKASDTWLSKDHVRVAEYFRRTQNRDQLIAYPDPENDGALLTMRLSKMREDLGADETDLILKDPQTRKRDILVDDIEWFKIAGNEIIESKEWPGKYIPIVRIVGEETVIDGKMDRKGHVRALKDPQRIYNYWTSSAVENVALQSKSPYVAAAQAIAGYDEYWKNANQKNYSYLPYNAFDEDGNQIPAPARQAPPVMSAAYTTGMQISQQEMMMASGQWQAQQGQNENAKSGVAINARQRQGDKATYHFIDGLAIGIRYTGMILIDLIPKIYDTQRIVRILAEDGVEKEVEVDPKAQQAYLEEQAETNDGIKAIFNPNIGRYAVHADIGPAYSTKRQEAWDAFREITSQNQQLTALIGDLMFRNADFPGADEIAERLKRLVPPQATGDAPPPEIQQMLDQSQAQMEHLKGIIETLTEELAKQQHKIDGKEIQAYEAETRRITALGNSQELTPEFIRPVLIQLLGEILSGQGQPEQVPMMAPMPQMEPDGDEMGGQELDPQAEYEAQGLQ